MNRALYAAATGMAAAQTNLDVISDNLANADVAGFKGATATFAEIGGAGGPGLGTVSLGEHTVFTQGKLMKSGGPFDVAIDGPGFFSLDDGRGGRAYSRDGSFSRCADGTLRNAQGWRLSGVRLSADALSASVSGDGSVSVTSPGGTRVVAHLRLAEFPAPERLRAIGNTLFAQTPQSGPARLVAPNEENGPRVRFGQLEQSNVSIVEAMMQILTAQRAYEANAKGVQAADEMLRIADNLSRG